MYAIDNSQSVGLFISCLPFLIVLNRLENELDPMHSLGMFFSRSVTRFALYKVYLTFTFRVYWGFVIKVKNLLSSIRITKFHKNDGIPYHVALYDLYIFYFLW